ncbi:glycine/betaine ABC transporter [Nocardioides sp. Root190]|nr:glycine/betaine ABC transporter [Nocardioides sp. Root190]
MLALVAAGSLALSACGDSDPLASGGGDGETIVIGSQDYYSNEIIAEIYAQALEADDIEVERTFRIGQREAYLPDIESGDIDLFPEYTGPLLIALEPDATATKPEEAYAALGDALPEGLRLLDASPATDQDSYVITKEFADKWDITTIEDLAKVTDPLVFGANSEAESRPNGPKGLKDTYGVDVTFTPIEDSGGPLTVKALNDGDIQVGLIYTADPSIKKNDLVTLEDTKGLFLASAVVPVASDDVSDDAAAIINEISAAMTPEDLIALNQRSVDEKLPAATIAKDWLAENDLG